MNEHRVGAVSRARTGRSPARSRHLGYDVEAAARTLAAAVSAAGGQWRLRVVDQPRREVLAAPPVPALDWTAARPVPDAGTLPLAPVRAVPNGLTNGLVTVETRPDGTLRVSGTDGCVLDGVGRIVDGGDAGDSYNYGPPPADTLGDEPSAVDVEPGLAGRCSARSPFAAATPDPPDCPGQAGHPPLWTATCRSRWSFAAANRSSGSR